MDIDINELLKLKSKTVINWDKIYDTVFKELIPIIKTNAKNGISEFIYKVPISVIGVPLYDVKRCTEYHVKKLRENGLRSQIQRDNFIAVSWRHREPDYVEEKIILPQPTSNTLKLKENKRFENPDFIPLMNNPMKIFRTNEYNHKNSSDEYTPIKKTPQVESPKLNTPEFQIRHLNNVVSGQEKVKKNKGKKSWVVKMY